MGLRHAANLWSVAALGLIVAVPDAAHARHRRYLVPVYWPAPVYTYSSYSPIYYSTQRIVPVQHVSARVERPAAVVALGIRDNQFEPRSIQVPAGTTVRWVNYGRHVHTVTSSNPKWQWDSGDMVPGQAFSVTFEEPGVYRYHCRHHRGMEATIIVGTVRPVTTPVGITR